MKEITKAYKRPSIKDILVDKKWEVISTDYNEKNGKYDIKAVHENGEEVELSRNRQYVDNLVNELLEKKRNEEQ
tara:strand:- start:6120 stop:6341 length:222 start_codon:yes stop_codon:yes gene_type:complete